MNYLIIGFGAVGTILANSIILDKEDKIYAIKSKKSSEKILKIETDVIENLKDKIKLNKNEIYQYDDEPIDIAFVTIKSNFLDNIVDFLNKLKKQNAKVICLMNGMGWEHYFDGFEKYYGIIMYNAFRKEDKVILGSKGGLILEKKIELILKNRFQTIPLTYAENIDQYRYRKLWLNTINGFLSLFGFSLSGFFEESKKLENEPLIIFKQYLEETEDLFNKLNIKTCTLPSLDPKILINIMDKLINNEILNESEEKLYNNLPKGKNSTLQSIENKESTEYKYLGGFLRDLADKINLQYKLNRFVTNKILEFDRTKKFDFISLNKILKFH